MKLDAGALKRGCGGALRLADQLCQGELGMFRAALAEGAPITVGCTQQAPLFVEVAEAAGFAGEVAFANVRENAGWSDAGRAAGPKMAALLAAAAEPMPPAPLVALRSEGVALIYGRGEAAIEAGRRLAGVLDVTVLLDRPDEVVPPGTMEFPVLRGTIAAARGHLGAFELTVDGYARPAPSSRASLVFGPARDGARSRCDIVLDLSGGAPLFPAADLRPGYVRADPDHPAAVERAIADAGALVGEFDKPAFIRFEAGLCAHQRSRRVGCTRCLDLCPTGAIRPDGDHVSIDAAVCAGCGACASVCPTGAARYAAPPAAATLRRVRRMLIAFGQAGGTAPVLLVHDAPHGQALIDAAARLGRGLPADVIPLLVGEVGQVGPDVLAGALAYGAAGIVLLHRARPRHDTAGAERAVALVGALLAGLGRDPDAVSILATDDPDALWTIAARGAGVPAPSRFLPLGEGRHLLAMAVRELHRSAGAPPASIPLPAGAPFGGLEVDVAGCTLCLACVGACPTGALRADPDQPMLKFAEQDCVQCGLCRATCPERVIGLVPRLDVAAWLAPPVVIKQEAPFACTVCGKGFGTRASIARIEAKLAGSHWMFSGANTHRLALLRMCEDCRVEASVNEGFDPSGAPPRPAPRMS